MGLNLPFRICNSQSQIHYVISSDTADPSVTAPSLSIKPMFSMPFERDKQFTGREDILSRLEKCLQTQYRVSLHGLGGIGYVSFIIYRLVLIWSSPGNLKSPLNSPTDFATTIPEVTSSGYMLLILLGLIRLTKKLPGK